MHCKPSLFGALVTAFTTKSMKFSPNCIQCSGLLLLYIPSTFNTYQILIVARTLGPDPGGAPDGIKYRGFLCRPYLEGRFNLPPPFFLTAKQYRHSNYPRYLMAYMAIREMEYKYGTMSASTAPHLSPWITSSVRRPRKPAHLYDSLNQRLLSSPRSHMLLLALPVSLVLLRSARTC